MDARSYNDIALNKPEVNIDIEEELIDMPFADVWLNGQKRFWHQLTEEEKYSLAEKYPARPELPYGIRTLTMISTTYEIPIDYSELANNNQAITSITHKRRDPVGFTTGHALMHNPLRRGIPRFFSWALPFSVVPFFGLIAWKQYQHGFWFRSSA